MKVKTLLMTTVLATALMSACSTPQTVPKRDTPTLENKVTPQDTPAPFPTASASPRILQPYPYTTPIPPPTPTILDGVYTREVKFEGTPTPCRRCAPYRAEGGTWTLILDAGAFRVSHNVTNFQGIGSFTTSGDELVLFNDPNCHLSPGRYAWTQDGVSLVLTAIEDECAFGLRAKNLTAGAWGKRSEEIDKCQPPSTEAAVTGHWPAPAGCQ